MSRRNRRPQTAKRPNAEPSPVSAAKVIIIAILAALCLSLGILFCLMAVHGLHAAMRPEKSMIIEQGSAKIDASVGDGAFNVSVARRARGRGTRDDLARSRRGPD
ncbi:MAG: hypothetical protein ABSC71_21300 [Candidatus Acidiferrales bacterium]